MSLAVDEHFGFSGETKAKLISFLDGINGDGLSDRRRVAVFDADGTLWSDDISEAFFTYLADSNISPAGACSASEAWNNYLQVYANGDATAACGLLLQYFAGVSVKQFRQWARAFLKARPPHLFAPMVHLWQSLRSHGFEIWVCSASAKLLVCEALRATPLGQYILEDHVIGVECEAEGESEPTLTDRLVYVPYGANKAMFIQEFVRSKPLLCCGNSIGDRPFLELSQGVSLAVCSCPAESFEFPNEQRLQSEAVRRGWLTQHFEQDDLLSEAEAKSCQ